MKKIVFMGTPDFSVPILQALAREAYEIVLVVTQPDRPKGRKRVITPSPVKQAAEELGLPVFQPERLRNDYQKIIDVNPDIIVTAAYGQLLPNELLEAPPFGCINVHASLLPDLRGGAPIHHAIVQGKKETGITIMYMVEKLDAGDILTQVTVPIAADDHVGILHDKLSEAGARLLIETLPELFNKQLTPITQEEGQATFAANIKREDEWIDWNKSSAEIYNQIRGLHPWPVAYTTYLGKTMKIWWGETDDKTYDGEPGVIVAKNDQADFVVVCGDKKGIRVTEIQPAGKTRMHVKDFLQGSVDRIQVGVRLGE
ncbi:methionyl-tRNA formyltransferase [Oceanobacillus alkalisoli]|uniref:methionyl-tRNA formyltransferase n=1 Tax=Oceanobacillus alkalisoli TaxID=2925113 RepID=UPI001EF0AD0D|nr:methionyl-tRNA formyltransferase [Oceanobacillus alkalisoli]MCF3942483.1 methionyl-tRNA formyltransferase [Oceanobacillus alkalisoli]MCG5103540.1 methionyl-tRNA formyltransferase [Oceanobacillus alkalisoli]